MINVQNIKSAGILSNKGATSKFNLNQPGHLVKLVLHVNVMELYYMNNPICCISNSAAA